MIAGGRRRNDNNGNDENNNNNNNNNNKNNISNNKAQLLTDGSSSVCPWGFSEMLRPLAQQLTDDPYVALRPTPCNVQRATPSL